MPRIPSPLLPVTLEGRHVRLEPLSLDHVGALAEAAGRGRDTYGFTWVPDGLAATRDYVSAALAAREAGAMLPFATVAGGAGGDRVVGSTRFGNLDYWDHDRDGELPRPPGVPDVAEIGWTWLSPDAQRTPINTEAKLLMLTFAFETWRVVRVSLITDARNARSRAAIERVGARLDGVLRAHMRAADGTARDSAFYSIVAAEWPAVKEALALKAATSRSAARL